MKKKLINRSSANFLYDHYNIQQSLIKYNNGFYLTEGVNDIGLYENCFWLIDIICNHIINFDDELWEFSREDDNLFKLTGKNKNDFTFVELENLKSDFYFDDLIIVKRKKLLCLPIEENIY